NSENESICAFTHNKSVSSKFYRISVITTDSVMRKFAELEAVNTWEVDIIPLVETGGLFPAMHEVKGVEGKGLGTVARTNIIEGINVVYDFPMIMVDETVFEGRGLRQEQVERLMAKAVGGLRGDLNERFGELSGAGEKKDEGWEMKVFGKNAFKVKVKLGEEEKVFPNMMIVSRVNHDCAPNMGYYFDQKTLTQRLVAARDIRQGEELTIGYVDLTKPCATRQQLLKKLWGFNCTCRRCTLPPPEMQESNSRSDQIHDLLKQLDDHSSLEASPEKAELLVTLYEKEGLQARLYEAYYRAAFEWNAAGDAEKAVKYAKLCLEKGRSLRHAHSPFLEIMGVLIQNPEEHWSWRFRVKLRDLGI
ncbi:hypothetical protein QBC38DRAFT_531136, partial [Podospora fimiseda]